VPLIERLLGTDVLPSAEVGRGKARKLCRAAEVARGEYFTPTDEKAMPDFTSALPDSRDSEVEAWGLAAALVGEI